MENLDPDYIRFIENGGKIEELVQDVIDRMQYSKRFFFRLNQLIAQEESPFLIRTDEDSTTPTRVLKPEFQTQKLS